MAEKKDRVTNACDKFNNSITDCSEQEKKTEYEKVEELVKYLLRQDDEKLPLFCDALIATKQRHVVDILRRNGQQQQHVVMTIVCVILSSGWIHTLTCIVDSLVAVLGEDIWLCKWLCCNAV